MAFKMRGYSAFTKTDEDKNWKSPQSLEEDLESFRKDLKEAKTPEEKRNIGKDIHSVKNQIAARNRKNKK